MKMRYWPAGAVLLVLLILPSLPAQDTKGDPKSPPKISWKKITIDKAFRGEGVAVADVNKDGKLDILIGDVWFEAPDWKMHVIREDRVFKLDKYSESFGCFAEDLNGDGWPDLVVLPFPGREIYWYENPKGQPGPWKQHVIWHDCCNETPQYVDLFGKGKRVLIMGTQPKGSKGNQGQMAWFAPGTDPTQLWEMHPISEPSVPGTKEKPGKEIPGTQRFSHGLGVGDMNGDGRLDVLSTGGWWEQPANDDGKTPWKFHSANFGPACADMFAYDLDGDGKMDVISTSAHAVGMWWFQQRVGADGKAIFVQQDLFSKPAMEKTLRLSQTHALHCVDINGDGLKDLVTGRRWWAHGPKGDVNPDQPAFVYWFEARKAADGLISFLPHVVDDDSGIGTQFAVVDVNGDGLLDIVTSNKKGTYLFLQVRN
jgi:hypothetical protein